MVNSLLDRRFAALANPVRRAIVERLANGQASVGAITVGLGVSKPAVSRHLRILEESGVVARAVDGRVHRLRLARDGLAETETWLARQRESWERLFDVVAAEVEPR